MNALLIGKEPAWDLGYTYVKAPPYDAVVIGSLTLGQLLSFSDEQVLSALAEGKPVLLYTEGLPIAPHSRGLSAALGAKRRELKNWGIVFTDGIRPAAIFTPFCSQYSTTFWPSSAVIAKGFSIRICLPASAAAMACLAWSTTGEAI